jgi:hypothetical protein
MKKVLLALIVVILMTACKTTHDLQTTHDTVYISKVEKDVQIKYDSVYIDRWHSHIVSGDTVHLVDSVVVYRYRLDHDTMLVRDTIYKATYNTTEKEVVETNTPTWAWWSLGILILLAATGAVWLYFKVKKR